MKYTTAVSMKGAMFLVICLLFISGCAPFMAEHNEHIYERATSLKVESLALINKATEPYSKHQQESERLQMELDKAHEYAQGIALNDESTTQWAIVSNRNGHSMAGVLKRWEQEEALSSGFVVEVRKQVEAGFNEIIKLESRKLKPPHLQ